MSILCRTAAETLGLVFAALGFALVTLRFVFVALDFVFAALGLVFVTLVFFFMMMNSGLPQAQALLSRVWCQGLSNAAEVAGRISIFEGVNLEGKCYKRRHE